MKNTRILCTVSNDLSYDQRMIRICTTLSEHGYHVTLVGRHRQKSIPLIHQPFKQKRLAGGVESGKLFYILFNCRLLLHLLFAPCDVICAIDLDTILPVLFAGKIRRKKLVYDAHEFFTEVPEVIRRPAIQQFWKKVESFAVPKFNAAYTVSEGLVNLFSKQYKLPFELVRNVPFKGAYTPVQPSTPLILYQGALNEGRGLEAAIEAMQYIDAQLMLAGGGDIENDLKAQVDHLKLTHKISFTGFLPPNELKALTPKATIGLNLLENKGLSYYYSLANKFFDYVQHGIPSICIGFPEYVALTNHHKVALLVPDLSINELVKQINNLLNDYELYQNLVTNCRKAADEWCWENEQKTLLRVYKEIE